jgi:hypothetical protein
MGWILIKLQYHRLCYFRLIMKAHRRMYEYNIII